MKDLNEETLARASAYVDGEMDAEEREAFEAEMEGNPDLREEVEALKDAMSVLSGLGELRAPEDFDEAVQRKIRRRSRGRFFSQRSGLFRPRFQIELLAVVALVVLGAIFLVTNTGKYEPESLDPASGSGEDTPGQRGDDGDDSESGQTPGDDADSAAGAAADGEPDPGVPAPIEARRGRVAGGTIMPLRRVEFAYTVESTQEAPELERNLYGQFGRDSVAGESGRYVVTVPRDDLEAALERLDAWGTVSRQRVELEQHEPTADIRVVVAEENESSGADR